jgi:CheY-like chemotaxis protein
MVGKILVVEDDPVGRDLICDILRIEGHQPLEATNGAEALELYQAQCFDLVITDFVMPRLNGLKLIEQLHLLSPKLPIILVTAYLSIVARRIKLRNIAEVVPKPFEIDFLKSTVRRLLVNSAAR